MTGESAPRAIWALAARQHGVIARRQLLERGPTEAAIEHRLAGGRLHRVMRGVYAVGRPELTQHGRWMAAVLRCGPTAALSHTSAAACLGIGPREDDAIEVSVARKSCPRARQLRVHRRTTLRPRDLTTLDGIPVTGPVLTLVDLATRLSRPKLEAAINEADKRSLVDPGSLREELESLPRHPGVGPLRRMLDGHALLLTDSELERRFLRIVRSPLRFTHAQVGREPDAVSRTLRAVMARLDERRSA